MSLRLEYQLTPAMHVQMTSSPFVCGRVNMDEHTVDRSSIELAALDVDAILADRHAEIFHSEHSPSLTTTLSTTTIPGALDA
jgi:hypothetical protein